MNITATTTLGWASHSGYIRGKTIIISIAFALAIACSAAKASIVPPCPGEGCGCPQDNVEPCQRYCFELEPWSRYLSLTIIAENAGFAGINRFGIFDYDDPANRLEIFDGPDRAGDRAVVNFDLYNRQAWVDPRHKVNMGPVFGFYLDSSAEPMGGVFYSDSLLNSGQDYGVSHLICSAFGGPCVSGIMIGFEDLRVDAPGYDGDFDDMIIKAKNIRSHCIPEPATIALMGLCCIRWLSGRKRNN